MASEIREGSLNSDGERRGRTGRLRRTWSCHGHRNSCSKESFGSLNNGIVVVRPVVFTLTKALIFVSNLPVGRGTEGGCDVLGQVKVKGIMAARNPSGR